jgi:hypothetical protein
MALITALHNHTRAVMSARAGLPLLVFAARPVTDPNGTHDQPSPQAVNQVWHGPCFFDPKPRISS